MKEIMHMVVEDFLSYNGKSGLLLLVLACLFFLWLVERDRHIRVIFIYLETALFLVFICPIYAGIAKRIDTEIYYRVLWTIPMGVLVCYSIVKLFTMMKKPLSRALVCILAALLIMLNGDFVYTKTLHFKSVNPYHMPDVVMHVADSLYIENYTPKVALPAELLPFIRQYSAKLLTPYGRNILEPQWSFSHPLFDVMEAESYDTAQIATEAKLEQCMFVVLSSIKPQIGSLESQGYTYLGLVDGYYLYVDEAIVGELAAVGLLTPDEIGRLGG